MSAVSTYGQALFEAAKERDELEQTLQDVKDFDAALIENEELRLFYTGGQVAESQRRKAIDGLTEDMTVSARNFIKVLSDNDRAESLHEVVLRFEELVKEHLGRVEVRVTTAIELSDEEREKIRERLAGMLEGREVVLETDVNPDIMGGAVFRFGGTMFDGSVRGRMQSLREEMLERSVN
ncbi:ATP synthase F1 subunit delta [Rubrobacter indicoceani]|uniref:ATP synthase F1 subunit delta n=1 Tax=Rubrobacter indicoceani TaxID=2051957 RepID=UPI0013C416CB|nr:ATP synthase F1 subunit delta [Rubrobacter indicoceani]